jgi:CDP-diacylglycerol---glycerol-3-phosphate 3-phosphatidyltransferase
MLARWLRSWDRILLGPILASLIRCRVTPNGLTLTGLGAFVASACLVGRGHLVWAACLLLLGGLLDGLDGELARLGGTESLFGSFLDSVADHYGDAFVYAGLLWFSLQHGLKTDAVLILLSLFGSVFGSHVRSRAGMLGLDLKNVGIFTRCERVLVLACGLAADRVGAALWVLAVFNNLSALQRVFSVAGHPRSRR